MHQPIKSQISRRGEVSRDMSLPAPIGGWNTRDSQAEMSPRFSIYMENLFPTARTVQMRKGAADHATGFVDFPKHLMAWRGPTSQELYAATDDGIFEVTAAGAIGAAATTCTNGRCVHVNFNTTGGSYLVLVNGTDDLQYYNGTAWATIANFPISGGGTLLTKDISFINNFKRALYFIKKSTLNFYYLPVDQINGTVGFYPLGAIFSRGGTLIAMGNWTFDGGVGLDDYTVFASSEGQLAVYKGTDPSDDTKWALQGVYDMGRPLGQNCFCKYGGDLLYLSTTGLRSMIQGLVMSQVKSQGSISSLIDEAFIQAAVNYYGEEGWQVCLSPIDDLLVVNVPLVEFDVSEQYVMNLTTKAWCKFTGWNASCFELLEDQLYMGLGDRMSVAKAWFGRLDFDASITAYCKQAPQYLPPRSREKQIELVRPVMTTQGRFALNVEVDVDFADNTDYPSPAYNGDVTAVWDVAEWDDAVWASLPTTNIDWLTVAAKVGYCQALRLRIISIGAIIEWSSVDYAYMAGQVQG